MDDFRYTYSVARINALSTRLLDKAFVSRMLAAEPDDILRMLGETPYAESLAPVDSPIHIDKGLLRELSETYDLLGKICPDKELIDLFRVRYDFHNLKALLKSQITNVPHTDSIVDLGTYPIGELSAVVREQNYRFVPEYIRETALDAVAEHEKTRALSSISYSCDRAMWRYLTRKAAKSRNRIVIELFRDYIDLANIRAFIRLKEFARETEAFAHVFIPEGSYPLSLFLRHMGEELSLLFNHLARMDQGGQVAPQALAAWLEEESFWLFEIACDNLILQKFFEMRMMLFGIAPLIYYLLRKEAEAKLIRTVIRGKLMRMPRNQIEQRLRYLYV